MRSCLLGFSSRMNQREVRLLNWIELSELINDFGSSLNGSDKLMSSQNVSHRGAKIRVINIK